MAAAVATTPSKARTGVWTPWGQVLCDECDYAGLKASAAFPPNYDKRFKTLAAMDRTAEVEQPKGLLLGRCNECRCPCWVRDDVALLQQVGFKASDLGWGCPFGWKLQQTGGMCAALVFSTEGREIVVTAMDGDFYLGEYVHVAGEETVWEHPLRTWESASFYEGGVMKDAPALGALAEECARKAIEFIRNLDAEAPGKDCDAAGLVPCGAQWDPNS